MAKNTQGREEIAELFRIAEREPEDLARRHVALARKKAMRKRISLRAYNRKACRKCDTYWTSATLRVRTTPAAVVYTCLHCGERKRFRKP